ncbi:uncharacterized protein LOC110032209 [Phalaenopsis equestris]|uniref:uncharacterized protein LOC110032209 n=1 Tax=Phalaenopsis equestris TaxID=78828 RepID=UPI0009E5602F|nr:uncharacterized protein LOC110032209 [Phalaenopsis equestris]
MQTFSSHVVSIQSTMASLLPTSSLVLLLLIQISMSESPTGTIERTIKQQILATILPGQSPSSEIFLTSRCGKYAAHFLRLATTAPTAGGYGNDFCFIQVEDTNSGDSVWESECAPVRTSNTCTLLFDDNGLQVLDGSREAWSAEVNAFHPNTLQLVDLGDMIIIDKDGEVAWKGSDMPRSNQSCGFPGSPPLSAQIGLSGSLPFGLQPAADTSSKEESEVIEDSSLAPGQLPVVPTAAGPISGNGNGDSEPSSYRKPAEATFDSRRPAEIGLGFSGLPLMDNTPYDSGSLRGLEISSSVGIIFSAVLGALAGF